MTIPNFLPPTSAPARRMDMDDVSPDTPAIGATTPEFAALLARLANLDDTARAPAVNAAPENGVSLLDLVLDGPTVSAGDATSANTTTDALRYSILKHGRASDARALVGDIRPAGRDGSGARASSTAGHTLARIAGKRGTSVEQLLAMGDLQGADARGALDALLAQAGTPQAALLAASANMIAPTGDVSTPVRDTDALVPEFRSRLERVIARMKSEYGQDVQVVETVRSQDRQDFLFAQGRTRAGDVVTWTRDSAHTRGEAADVTIDGAWTNAEGFARLQRIAREEGLRTLGLRDPGHLELPKDGQSLDAASASAAAVDRHNAAMVSSTARVASIAGVANVAAVARVASTSAAPESTSRLAAPLAAYAAAGARTQADTNSSSDARTNDDRASTTDRGGMRERGNGRVPDATAFTTGTPMPSLTTTSGHPIANVAPAGAASADRVSDLQQRREDAPAAALSRMTLDVDGADGTKQRITVDLRGNIVDTHISTDAATADRLRMRTAELQDALNSRGLDSDSVRITSVARVDQAETTRLVGERAGLRPAGANASSSTNNDATPQQQRERSPNAREWDKQDDARRARDEQQQRADQRGRRSTFNEDAS